MIFFFGKNGFCLECVALSHFEIRKSCLLTAYSHSHVTFFVQFVFLYILEMIFSHVFKILLLIFSFVVSSFGWLSLLEKLSIWEGSNRVFAIINILISLKVAVLPLKNVVKFWSPNKCHIIFARCSTHHKSTYKLLIKPDLLMFIISL